MLIPFNPTQFKIEYPAFADYSDIALTNTFNYSATVIGQVVSSLFTEDDVKYYWLTVTLAHLLTLESSGALGRLSKAKEGSISGDFDMNVKSGYEFWATTIYGQRIMQVLETYLSGIHYVPFGDAGFNGDAVTPYGGNDWIGMY